MYSVRFREVSGLSSFKNFWNQTTDCGDIAYCLGGSLFWATHVRAYVYAHGGVHSIYTSKVDDHFIHCPQCTGYPPKLTSRILHPLPPLKNFTSRSAVECNLQFTPLN